jgi:uncharacterized protein involved in exopolysaccharide biosynthesis
MDKEDLPIVPSPDGETLHLAPDYGSTPDLVARPEPSGLGLHDILFMLFRHKWKVLVLTFVGLLTAAVVYLLTPPAYESEAKLLVRYVVERSAVDGESQIKTPGPDNHALINSEVQILTSEDLIRQVAQTLGVDRFALGAAPDLKMEKAIESIDRALDVSVVKDTNVISVAFSKITQARCTRTGKAILRQTFSRPSFNRGI